MSLYTAQMVRSLLISCCWLKFCGRAQFPHQQVKWKFCILRSSCFPGLWKHYSLFSLEDINTDECSIKNTNHDKQPDYGNVIENSKGSESPPEGQDYLLKTEHAYTQLNDKNQVRYVLNSSVLAWRKNWPIFPVAQLFVQLFIFAEIQEKIKLTNYFCCSTVRTSLYASQK